MYSYLVHIWDCCREHSPGCTHTYVHIWDCSREHSPGCTRTFGCGGCPSMQQSGLSISFVFYVPSLWPPLFLFHCRAFTSGTNIAWNERSFVCASRFPEARVSERQISRVFWTIRNSQFPKFAEQNNIRSSYSFLPRFSLESVLYSLDFESSLEEFCLTDTLCRETRQHVLAFTLKENFVKSFLDIFSWERIRAQSCNRVQNSVLSLQYQDNWTCFCLRCFGLSPILLQHRIFLLGGVSFNNVNLVNKEWFFSRHVGWTSRLKWCIKFFPVLCVSPEKPCWFLRHLLFLQVQIFPYRHEDSPLRFSLFTVYSRLRVGSWNSQSLPGNFAEPSATRNIYSTSLRVIQTSFAISLLGFFLTHLTFPILQSQQSEHLLPKFPPRTKHVLHFEISRLPGGPGHLADSNSTP